MNSINQPQGTANFFLIGFFILLILEGHIPNAACSLADREDISVFYKLSLSTPIYHVGEALFLQTNKVHLNRHA